MSEESYVSENITINIVMSILTLIGSWLTARKTARTQIDRPKKREIYQKIHDHFVILRRGVSAHSPPTRIDFIDYHLTGGRNITPMEQMKELGETRLICSDVMARAVNLEKEAFNYGTMMHETIEKIHDILTRDLTLYCEGHRFIPSERMDNFETANPSQCARPYQERPFTTSFGYGFFFDKRKTAELFHKAFTNECYVEFLYESKQRNISFKLHPQGVMNKDKFISVIYERFNDEIKDFNKLSNVETRIGDKIDGFIRKLGKCIQNP